MMILATFGEVVISVMVTGLALLLIGLVLLQKNRGSGLSGAFGGVGGHSAFGTKTGDFLTWVTVGVTAAFLLMCVIGVYWFQPDYTDNTVVASEPQPPSSPQPVPQAPVPAQQAPAQQVPAQQAAEPPTQQPPAATPGTPDAGQAVDPAPAGDAGAGAQSSGADQGAEPSKP